MQSDHQTGHVVQPLHISTSIRALTLYLRPHITGHKYTSGRKSEPIALPKL
jgi:hypothetical protein